MLVGNTTLHRKRQRHGTPRASPPRLLRRAQGAAGEPGRHLARNGPGSSTSHLDTCPGRKSDYEHRPGQRRWGRLWEFPGPDTRGVEAGLELLPGRPWSSGPPRSKPTSGVQMAGGWVFTWPLHPGDTSYRIHTWGTPTSVSYHLARLSLAPQGLPPRPPSQPGQTPLCFSHRLRPRGSLWLAASLPSRLQVTTQQTVRAEARIPPLNIPLIQTRRKLPSSVWGGSGSHDAVHQMRSVFTALGPEQTRGILDSLGWKGSYKTSYVATPQPLPLPSRAWRSQCN